MPQASPAGEMLMPERFPPVATRTVATNAATKASSSVARGPRLSVTKVMSMQKTMLSAWSTVAVPALVRLMVTTKVTCTRKSPRQPKMSRPRRVGASWRIAESFSRSVTHIATINAAEAPSMRMTVTSSGAMS